MVEDVLTALVPGSARFRAEVEAAIEAFLGRQRAQLAPMGPALEPVGELAAELLGGGKRLRPAFCAAGFLAVAGQPGRDVRAGLITAAASLELLHVSALVHDDVMDASDLRRGRPAAHRQLEARHRDAGWLGDPESFGRAGAILLGDLLLMWSVEMLRTAPLPATMVTAAEPVAEAMRTEVTGGQYLDVLAQAQPFAGASLELDQISRVVEFKSARYSVQRPCQLGAALADADAIQQQSLADFGLAVGRAFQYRDDLLGVYGDPAVTGKPAGDDLREGKRTVLIAHAYAAAAESGRELIRRRLGDPGLDETGVRELRALIDATGARDEVEKMITADHLAASSALGHAEFTEAGRDALVRLADAAISRSS